MPHLHELVAKVVSLAGGEIYGRIRIQKIMYLLDQKGLNSNASYFYHHYGPYSEDVSDAIMDAKFFGLLKEEGKSRVSDGMPYSVFTVTDSSNDAVSPVEKFKSLIGELGDADSTTLELAATIHWLSVEEKISDWRGELVKRKPSKATPDRVNKASDLLSKLELAPSN